MTPIVIILATYNGAEFLSQQIQSIYTQLDHQSLLIIRDDGSKDITPVLLHDLSKRCPNIKIINDDKGSVGVLDNFSLLLEYAYNNGALQVVLADQDDVWMEDKVALQTSCMKKMENNFIDEPLLVHSNMEVVDSSLKKINESFMKYQGIQHETDALPVLLPQNFVTGCTMMINRKLLDIALPVPDEALMHDWWLALCAAVFGQIGYIDKPLVKYRQHGKNEVGAKHLGDYINPMHGEWKKHWLEGRTNLFQSMRQASALAARVREHDPSNPNLALIESYATMDKASPLARIAGIHKSGVHMQSGIRQALMLSRLLLTPEGWHV